MRVRLRGPQGSLGGRSARTLSALAATVALFGVGAAPASAGIFTDTSVGTGAPPATLGGYPMTPFAADATPIFTTEATIPAPGGGSLGFTPSLSHRTIGGGGWATWSNGYTGDVYVTTGQTITLTLPAGTTAFDFYAEPQQFGNFTITATANDGTTATQTVNGSAGAKFYGFFSTGVAIASITVTVTDPTGFAVGEFALSMVPASADLSLTKTAVPTTVPHGNVVYTLTESNAGPNPAAAPTIVDTLPAGQSFVAAGSSPGCTAAGQMVTCTGADLPGGSSITTTIVASTAPTASPLYAPVMETNTATVSSTTPDPGPGANTATATVTVVPGADLTLNKTGSPNPVIGGQGLVYTLTGTNNGPDPAANPTITDTLPAGEIFNPETSSPGCTAVGQVVTCPVGPLSGPTPPGYINAGASYTVTIGVIPTNTTGATQTDTNTATIASTTADPNPANNTATAAITVRTSCTVTKTGNIVGFIDVQAGTSLCLNNATVTGSIQVDPGGGLTLTNSRIAGAITSNGAQFVSVCGTSEQSGSGFVIKNTTGLVRIGDDVTGCAGNNISGSLTLSGNTGGIEAYNNTVAGALSLTNNIAASPIGDGTPEIEGNHFGGSMLCHGNVPPPVNDGLTNTAVCAKAGQCTAL